MYTLSLTFFEGHPIVKIDDNILLIDTGAPTTIHTNDRLNFFSDIYTCSTNYMGLTIDRLSEMLGSKVTTLLGMDVLKNYIIIFDYRNKLVTFSNTFSTHEGTEISIDTFMGIPIIELSVDNQVLRFFLDTGAKISYLLKEITDNYESVSIENDFYPGIGEFQTECFNIVTTIDNIQFDVKYGYLPTLLQMTLSMAEVNGIIGFDFFNQFNVELDLKSQRLKYIKNTD